MQYPDDPEHPEDHHAGKEKHRHDGEEIHDAVVGHQESQASPAGSLFFIQKVRRPDPQHVLHAEKQCRHHLHDPEKGKVLLHLAESLQDHHQDVQEDIQHEHIVEDQAGNVTFISYLNDVKSFLLHVNNYTFSEVPLQEKQCPQRNRSLRRAADSFDFVGIDLSPYFLTVTLIFLARPFCAKAYT